MSQNTSKPNSTKNRTDRAELIYHFSDGIRRLFLLIILFALVGAIIAFIVYTVTFKPVYSVSVVSTVSADVAGNNNYYNEANASQIAAVFPQIVESDTMKNKLLLGTEGGKVGSISASATEESNLFTIKVTSNDPEVAFNTMIAIVDYYPDLMEYVLGPTQLSILTEPMFPTTPEKPYMPFEAMMIGTITGIIVALIFIFADAYFQDTVIVPEDIKEKLGAKCLGEIPLIMQKKSVPVTVLENIRQNNFTDSVRSLTNRFVNETGKSEAKVILMTSTFPEEGKTTVSVNISLLLASKGKKVLLCDADIKSPAVARTLGISETVTESYKGLEGLLTDEEELSKALSGSVLHIEKTGLDVILSVGKHSGSKAIADSSSELLGSGRMKELTAILKEQYDYVIFDTAPAGLVSDAQSLARVSDGFVFIVRQDTVRTEKIVGTLNSFSFTGAKPLGVVINMSKYYRAGTGYGKYGYGKYGYGKNSYGYGSYGNEKEKSY